METKRDETLQEIGQDAFESIAEMIAALRCDYDRLEELRDEKDETGELSESDSEELSELEESAGDCDCVDDARQRIQEDAISVQVRSGWHDSGSTAEPEEFEILLSTGGPATRIIGDLTSCCEPYRAVLQSQGCGTPWIDTDVVGCDVDILVAYCEQFYFGGN